jgi:competence protein ComEA
MKFNYRPFLDLFGYTRRDRRASFVLLVIIFSLSMLKYLVPVRHADIKDMTDIYAAEAGAGPVTGNNLSDSAEAVSFDPNTASYNELINAGLDRRQASTLISYRTSGGKFRTKNDLGRVYGISEKKADSLKPFIKIVDSDIGENRGNKAVVSKLQMPFDINTCDSARLESLPGIGPVLAARIIKFRNLLGGYYSVEQLREVYGLPAETYGRICNMIYADTSMIKRININAADYRTLSRIIYLDGYEIKAILKYRDLMDSIRTLKELVSNRLISEEKEGKIKYYLRFQ